MQEMKELLINPTPSQSSVEYSLIHRTQERLRLKIPLLATDKDYAFTLEQLIIKTDIIKDYRINLAAASLVVFYEPENVTEEVILAELENLIHTASHNKEIVELYPVQGQNFNFLPMLAMVTAIAAAPLEVPLFLVGGLLVGASVPLWQRAWFGLTQEGVINFDSLDAIWLSAQIIQGNVIAGALAVNLSQIGEGIRQNNSQRIERQLYGLLEAEGEKNWVKSVEETELMQQVKPLAQKTVLPTLLLSAITGLVTNDLSRASAWLPLNVGVSLRGVTPLAIVSALTVAAKSQVYISHGKTLEKLAQIDILLLGKEHIKFKEELASAWDIQYVEDSQDIEQTIQSLQAQGHKVAWLDEGSNKGNQC